MRSLISLAAVVALLTGCGSRSAAPGGQSDLPLASVRLQTLQSVPEIATEEVAATVRARVRATLEARVSGRIQWMPIVLGQKVRAGEPLVRLDAAEMQARLQQSQAAYEQAERDWKRVSILVQQQAVSRAEADATEARLNQTRAAVAEARTMMDYIEIRAPFEGVVTRKLADVGDLAAPGKGLLLIEDPSLLQLEADIPESIMDLVQLNCPMKVLFDSGRSSLDATVSELAPAVDSDSRTFHVKLDLPAATALRAGQFARLLVPAGTNAVLRVPSTAVVRRGQLDLVFSAAEGRAHLRLVKTGRSSGGSLEILSGLDPGESVVVEGASALTDGQRIQAR